MSRGPAKHQAIAALVALSALAGAGLATAQQTPPTPAPASPNGQPQLINPPPPNGAPTPPSPQLPTADEEAPPVQVTPPPPVVAPPIEAEEVEAAPPPKAQVAAKPSEAAIRRARYDVAVIQALDKVSAESMRFEAAVGKPVRYKNLVFTVRACERSAADEAVNDSIAHITVESQPRAAPGKPTPPPRQAFRGWMYASSPGLNPLEHPVYDAWLITCRAAAPAPVATS